MEIIIISLLLIMMVGGFIAGFNYCDSLNACNYEFKDCLNDLEEIGVDLDRDGFVKDAAVSERMWKMYSQAYRHMEGAARVSMSVIIIEIILFAVVLAVATWAYS